VQRPAADDVRPQAAAVDKGPPDAGDVGQLFQVPARLAQFHAAEDHLADRKLPADQMVQRHSLREQVAARDEVVELQLVLLAGGRDGLAFDQRHFLIGTDNTAAVLAQRVIIVHDAAAGDNRDAVARRHGRGFRRVDRNGQQPAFEHGRFL
jgi:hypothetical protein